MVRMAVGAVLLWGMLMGATARPSDTIGAIDFFGYDGLDVAKVREALPAHVGDELTDQTRRTIENAVAGVIGMKPTDVAEVCCDEKGRSLIYIGLPGKTYKPFALNPAPTGNDKLPAEIVTLESKAEDADFAAVKKGTAEEDDSMGYALTKDTAARGFQLQEREWALAHAPDLLRVMRSSSDAEQRRVASEVLGYAQQSHEQISALVYASRDPDSIVRNNATRALGVLVRSNPGLTSDIDAGKFIELLGSGTWTDHNKAVDLLDAMSVGRDPQVLAKIRSEAMEPLVEMAMWSEAGHATWARLVLGRVGGIPEDKLIKMAWSGRVDAIIDAARK